MELIPGQLQTTRRRRAGRPTRRVEFV